MPVRRAARAADLPPLSQQALTAAEQRALLAATAGHPRDHLIFSVALGTGLRFGEIVGLDVGDVFLPDALLAKLARFWAYKLSRRESLDSSDAPSPRKAPVIFMVAGSRGGNAAHAS